MRESCEGFYCGLVEVVTLRRCVSQYVQLVISGLQGKRPLRESECRKDSWEKSTKRPKQIYCFSFVALMKIGVEFGSQQVIPQRKITFLQNPSWARSMVCSCLPNGLSYMSHSTFIVLLDLFSVDRKYFVYLVISFSLRCESAFFFLYKYNVFGW